MKNISVSTFNNFPGVTFAVDGRQITTTEIMNALANNSWMPAAIEEIEKHLEKISKWDDGSAYSLSLELEKIISRHRNGEADD